jgi:hypothetical protein
MSIAWRMYDQTVGLWPKLEAAAGRLDNPDGMQRVLQAKQGDVFCFVSCESGEATLFVVYRTSLQPRDACESFEAEIRESVAPTRANDTGRETWWCRFEAPLPEIHEDAKVMVASVDAKEFRTSSYKPDWFGEVSPPDGDQRYVWATFFAGNE